MAFYYSSHRPPSATLSSLSSSSGAAVTPVSHQSFSQPPQHQHHNNRPRRGARLSNVQNTPKMFRGVRSMRELTEAAAMAASRARFEAGRSFDLDDDIEFCPALLTQDDLFFISSPASSDRSSFSSGSPESSPLQQQAQPSQPVSATPMLSPHAASHPPPPSMLPQYQSPFGMKLHEPSAVRTRNAIPIVNPSTGMRVPSRPESLSPGLSALGRRW